MRRELNSNTVATYQVNFGDPDAAFAKAAHVFHTDLWQHRGAGHPIEGRGILAEFHRGTDGLTVWASTQKANDLFQTITSLFDIDESKLRVITPEVGGGFGPKLCIYSEDIAVVAAATLLQRSIKWIEDRREHFTNAAQERDQYWSIDIAVDRRRQGARDPRQPGARRRRLRAAGRQHPVQLRLDDERSLHRAVAAHGRGGRRHQQDPGLPDPRRRPSAGRGSRWSG